MTFFSFLRLSFSFIHDYYLIIGADYEYGRCISTALIHSRTENENMFYCWDTASVIVFFIECIFDHGWLHSYLKRPMTSCNHSCCKEQSVSASCCAKIDTVNMFEMTIFSLSHRGLCDFVLIELQELYILLLFVFVLNVWEESLHGEFWCVWIGYVERKSNNEFNAQNFSAPLERGFQRDQLILQCYLI